MRALYILLGWLSVVHRAKAGSQSQALSPFHLALPVSNLEEARLFYGGVLGLAEGRSSALWRDFSLMGHQLVCHLVPPDYPFARESNVVDGDMVPVPHCGVVLDLDTFFAFAERLESQGVEFVIKPHKRFQGTPGEQYTMFFYDPSGNALEFKAMTHPLNLFAKFEKGEL